MTEEKKLCNALKEHFVPFIEQYGDSFKSVNWGSKESQNLRFDMLLNPFIESNVSENRLSVLDVGCGLGHLYTFLQDKGLPIDYRGIDIVPDMVAKAKERHPDVRFDVGTVSDLLEESYDIVVASGIFYVAYDQESMNTELAKMFSLCRRGIAFNSLSKWAPELKQPDFYADPLEVLSFCRTLSTCCTLRHDYFPHDFTVHVFRTSLINI